MPASAFCRLCACGQGAGLESGLDLSSSSAVLSHVASLSQLLHRTGLEARVGGLL